MSLLGFINLWHVTFLLRLRNGSNVLHLTHGNSIDCSPKWIWRVEDLSVVRNLYEGRRLARTQRSKSVSGGKSLSENDATVIVIRPEDGNRSFRHSILPVDSVRCMNTFRSTGTVVWCDCAKYTSTEGSKGPSEEWRCASLEAETHPSTLTQDVHPTLLRISTNQKTIFQKEFLSILIGIWLSCKRYNNNNDNNEIAKKESNEKRDKERKSLRRTTPP